MIGDVIVDEANWLPVAMGLAALMVVVWRRRGETSSETPAHQTLRAMSLFYAAMIGTMAFGHLLAVTVTASRGALQGSPLFLYTLGLGLAVPAWWLVATTWRRETGVPTLRRIVALNSWLGLGLIALGVHNLPIAAPSALNIAYRYHQKPAVGTSIVVVLAAGYLMLFVGGVWFMASGQTFEEFQGIARLAAPRASGFDSLPARSPY